MQRAFTALMLASVIGCGGQVVFVEGDDGAGGGGGTFSIPTTSGFGASGPGPVGPGPGVGGSAQGPGPGSGGSSSVACDTFECSNDGATCDCFGECSICQGNGCSGGEAEMFCQTDEDVAACDCFFGGGFVGSCEQIGLNCTLDQGCCFNLLLDGLGG